MSQCVRDAGNGYYSTYRADETCDFMLVSPTEYQALTSVDTNESLVTLLDAIFVFDVGTCSAVVGASLLMFFISHSAGNIVRWLGRY